MAGLVPLRLETHLSALAERRAEAQARAGILQGELGTESVLQLVQRGGYEAFMISELLASGDGLDGIFADWQTRGSSTYHELLESQVRDLGVGLAERDGTTFVALFLGLSWTDYFTDRTRGLADLELVRRQMLQRVNDERRTAGRPPLVLEPRLVQCAQRYADLMLARSHYGHRGPDGDTIRERAERAGYDKYLALGENLAQGQYSVQEVMDGWMQSPGHRENLLSPGFRDVGFGLAYGHNGNGWQVLWVQCLGEPRRQ